MIFRMISLFCGAQRKSVNRLQVGWALAVAGESKRTISSLRIVQGSFESSVRRLRSSGFAGADHGGSLR